MFRILYLVSFYKHAVPPHLSLGRAVLLLAFLGLTAASVLTPCVANASDGVLDSAFGTRGKVVTDIRSSDDAVRGMTLQPDGKIVVAGSSYVYAPSPKYVFAVARYSAEGTLDSSFAGGVVTTPFGSDDATANAVAIQSDGKIIAAGYTTPNSYLPATAMALARYNPDGSLDTTFGTGGRVSTPVSTPSGGNAQIEAIVIQPDGKILVGGHVIWDFYTSKTVFLLARYNPDGTLDASFANAGILTQSVGGSCANSSSGAYAITLQPDGKIVATGYAFVNCPAELRFAVTRYNSDGTPDQTFNGNGIVTMFKTAGSRKGWVGGAAVAIQPDGKIVLTGPTGIDGSNGTQLFAILRLKPDGAPDMSFGSMGIVTTMLGSRSEAFALQLQADGKLVVAGDAYVGTQSAFGMARFNGDGSLDTTFGTNGFVISDFNAQDDGVNAMAIQADGKLLLAGFSHAVGSAYADFTVARYTGTNPHPLAVNSIRSRFGGNTGPVTVTVFGAGFQPGTQVRLVCSGQNDIVGTAVRVNAGGVSLSVLFNLTGAAPGSCDVVVKNPDGPTATLPGGFAIVLGTPGHPWIAVLGRTTVRAGSSERMYIHMGNSGNVDAVVPFWVAFHLDPQTHAPQGSLGFTPYNGPLDPDANGIDYDQVPLSFDRIDPETGDAQRTYPMAIYVPAGGDVLLPVNLDSLCEPKEAMKVGIGDPMDTPIDRATGQCMIDIASLLPNLIPGSECIKGPLQLLLFDALQERWGEPASISSFAVSDLTMVVKCAASFYPPAEMAMAVYDVLSSGWAGVNSCGKMMGAGSQTQYGVNHTCVYSHDPNDKVGNKGFGAQGYLPANEPLGYSIFFENKPDASAPAQDIVVTDQLDPAKVDLSTFSLGPITIGNKLLTPAAGLTQFAGDLDLRPDNNIIAHVSANLDRTSGLLKWTFGSIDPATGLPTTDPLAGLLPPNVNAPAGEGSVLFTVSPKEDLPTDTAITNQASIVFDNNAPLATPTWLNTIDRTQPVSQVLALAPTQPTAKFAVQWSGTDVGSGIKQFSVFVSDNDKPFTQWLEHRSVTSDTFSGQNGHTYRFFSVAEDNAGNVEPGKTDAEAVTVVNIPDAVPPVTVAEESPTANASGWHKQDFTVTLTATNNDGGSGVQQITYSASDATVIGSTNVAGNSVTIPVTAEGTTTIRFYATDKAGNAEAANSLTVRLDKTAPEITASRTPLANSNGWNNTDVTVSFTCSDALSGLAPGNPPDNVILSAEKAGQSASGTCTDLAGNSASAKVSSINVDQTPPVVTVTGFTDGDSYTPGALPTAGCTTSDALSGVATSATVSVTGGTDGVGKFTATCRGAADVAGNVAPTATASYYVRYNFIGFLSPFVAGEGSYSGSYKLGRTIPVKWQLTNAQGAYVSSLSSVTSLKVAFRGQCTTDPGESSDLGTSGNTELRYDATANQFIYNWNTSNLVSGCYEIQLSLDDKGPAHTTVVNLKQ